MIENRKYKKNTGGLLSGICHAGHLCQLCAPPFLTFQDLYKISLEQIALIPVVFYLTQLLIDLGATSSQTNLVTAFVW